MKLSISNIGWEAEDDSRVYELMKKYGFEGLEIAPTRIFPNNPYCKLSAAKMWSENLIEQYGFVVPSMQSIWYGCQEKMFGSDSERQQLIEYTKMAVDFASVIGCHNLVFGCPRNRNLPKSADRNIGTDFFRTISDYAAEKGTVIGMEANPPIYNTNYINDTKSAFQLINSVNSAGFRLNLDVGTMVENRENVAELEGKVCLINHVHISEPGLKTIEKRQLHRSLWQLLNSEGYDRFVSIEVGKTADIRKLEEQMDYVREIFG